MIVWGEAESSVRDVAEVDRGAPEDPESAPGGAATRLDQPDPPPDAPVSADDGAEAHPASTPSGALYRTVVESSVYAHLVVDEAGTIRYCSRGLADVTGRDPASVLGENIVEHLHPDDLEVALRSFAEIGDEWGQRSGDGVPLALRLQCADGSWRDVEAGARNATDDPAVRGIVVRLRPADVERALARSIAALAGHRPTTEVFAPLVQALCRALPGSRAVHVVWDRADDRFTSVVGAELEEMPARWAEDRDAVAALALEAGEITSVERPGGAVWAVPVGEGADGACVIVARGLPGPPWTTHRVAVDRICHVISLALARRHSDRLLEFAASHDQLTGLANRGTFFAHLTSLLGAGPHRPTAVLYLDLDGFKAVNDSYGHAIGDEVLRVVGRRLDLAAREDDLVGRLGGDEFAVACGAVADPAAAADVADRVLDHLRGPVALDRAHATIDASVGVAFVPAGHGQHTADHVVEAADRRLYLAKRAGGGRVEVTTVV